MISRPLRGALFVSAAALTLATLAGCSSDDAGQSADSPAASVPAGCALTVADQWVKATDSGMTGVFGTISNPGQAAVTVVAVTSPVAGMAEIHEVVEVDGQPAMQPKQGGLVIPAGGTATLAPGADHLMLMDLTGPVQAGDQVEVTLECASGATTQFVAVAKPFAGGEETYVPSDGMDSGDMASMSPSSEG